MEEIGGGRPRGGPVLNLPADARVVERTYSYEIRHSAEEGSILIVTTSYHPGTLYLTRADLRKMIDILDGQPSAGGRP